MADARSLVEGNHDVIVVGSGVAGLCAAIEAAEAGLRVALLAKDSASESSTGLAQGGVAVALSDEDQVGLHYSDTIAAGDGLCDESTVSMMVSEGPRVITRLIEWGARFDKEGARLAFTREGAHSARRILHAQGDATGREILRTLWQKAATLGRITFFPHICSVELLVESNACVGLRLLDESERVILDARARAVVLATGGAGRVFSETTNPAPATGDGIAIAWRAGARLRDMEFFQFHPTALHIEGAPRFLLSEALRGEGAILLSVDGRRFMPEVDPRAELSPRDIVSRTIFGEMARTGADHVLLDMTHREPGFVARRFPGIYRTCLGFGLDLSQLPAPVAPAAHYMMGGIETDPRGRTSVAGLYAAGEVACTGVHGANRLASNSLLEGLVFGARAGLAVLEDSLTPARVSEGNGVTRMAAIPAPGCLPGDASSVTARVREIAWTRLGIVRDASGLASAINELDAIQQSMPPAISSAGPGLQSAQARAGIEAGNMATVALLMAVAALAREESRGAHFRSDYPRREDDRWRVSLRIEGATRRVTQGCVSPELAPVADPWRALRPEQTALKRSNGRGRRTS